MSENALKVGYEITEDNTDGSPWMPDGNAVWAIVSRASGFTTWRRLILAKKLISAADSDRGKI
jgi:hypothetical protein